MYSYRYYLVMKIVEKVDAISSSDIIDINAIRLVYNASFQNMNRRNCKNKKYISKIDILPNQKLGFNLETEKPLTNPNKYGNALRLFSILAANYGIGKHIKNNRLLKVS